MLVEPVGEALVQLGAGRLRQSARRRRHGSADGGTERHPRRRTARVSGRMSSLRTSAVSAVVSSAPPARVPGRRPGGTVHPRPRRARARSARAVELVEASRQQRLDRRRNADLAVARLLHAARPSPRRKRVALGGRRWIRSRSALVQLREARRSAAAVSAASSGSSSTRRRVRPCRRPSRPPVEQLRPRHAEHRIGASRERSATCSTRSRNVSSPQWRSSNTQTSGCSARDRLEQLAERPGDLLARGRRASVSPSSDRIVSAATGSTSDRGELLDDLDHRPVRDPLAVRKAAASHDQRVVERAQGTPPTSRDLPTPAAPRTVKSWHARSRRARSDTLAQLPQLPLAADHRPGRVPRERLRSVDREQAVGATGSALPFSVSGSTARPSTASRVSR